MKHKFTYNSKTKKAVDVNFTVNMAINYVKSNPCCICSYEDCCEIKYKGTCPIWRKLKLQLFELRLVGEQE